jgi:hypothetical protein
MVITQYNIIELDIELNKYYQENISNYRMKCIDFIKNQNIKNMYHHIFNKFLLEIIQNNIIQLDIRLSKYYQENIKNYRMLDTGF